MFRIEQLQVLQYSSRAAIRQYEEMPRRLKIVRKRKQEEDDLSFIPPYSEQAKYLDLANAFLSLQNTEENQQKVICIEEGRRESTTSAADEIPTNRKLG